MARRFPPMRQFWGSLPAYEALAGRACFTAAKNAMSGVVLQDADAAGALRRPRVLARVACEPASQRSPSLLFPRSRTRCCRTHLGRLHP